MVSNHSIENQIKLQKRLNTLRSEYFNQSSYGKLADLIHKHATPATVTSRLGFGINEKGEDSPICISDNYNLPSQPKEFSTAGSNSFLRVITNESQKREVLEISGFITAELKSFALKVSGALDYINNLNTNNKVCLVICHSIVYPIQRNLDLGSVQLSECLKKEISEINSKDSMEDFLDIWGTHLVTGYSNCSAFFGLMEIEVASQYEKQKIAERIRANLNMTLEVESPLIDEETIRMLRNYRCTYNVQLTGIRNLFSVSPSNLVELLNSYAEYCRQSLQFSESETVSAIIHCTPWVSLRVFLDNRNAIKYLKETSRKRVEELKQSIDAITQEIESIGNELSVSLETIKEIPQNLLFNPNKTYKIILCDNRCGVENYFLAAHSRFEKDLRNEVSTFVMTHRRRDSSNSSWRILPSGLNSYTIQVPKDLIKDNQVDQTGWFLSAHWTTSKDHRNKEAMHAMIHSPNQRINHEWIIERYTEELFTITLAKDYLCSREDVTGWFLSCHNYFKNDKRDEDSFYAIVHRPGWGGKLWRIQEE